MPSRNKVIPDRIRFGCCGSMIAPSTDPVGVEIIEPLASLGFDYIELSLRDLAAFPPSSIDRIADRLLRAGLPCEACNNFIPPHFRLTGPAADLPAALHYADKALAIAARLGVAVVVFGSAGARNIPTGFPVDIARSQLRDFLSALGPIAERHNVTIAIEHLNRRESNVLNTLAESARLAEAVAHPRIRLLADAYHLLEEKESSTVVAQVAPALAHAHIAHGSERLFPVENDRPLTEFFHQLRAAHYIGRCSIEAYTRDFATDAARALWICCDLASAPTDLNR